MPQALWPRLFPYQVTIPVLATLPCAGLTFLTVLTEVLLSRPMAQPSELTCLDIVSHHLGAKTCLGLATEAQCGLGQLLSLPQIMLYLLAALTCIAFCRVACGSYCGLCLGAPCLPVSFPRNISFIHQTQEAPILPRDCPSDPGFEPLSALLSPLSRTFLSKPHCHSFIGGC